MAVITSVTATIARKRMKLMLCIAVGLLVSRVGHAVELGGLAHVQARHDPRHHELSARVDPGPGDLADGRIFEDMSVRGQDREKDVESEEELGGRYQELPLRCVLCLFC